MATGGGWGACDEGGGVIEDGGGGGEVYFDRSRAAEEADSVPESQDSSAPEAMRSRILMRYAWSAVLVVVASLTAKTAIVCCGKAMRRMLSLCETWSDDARDAAGRTKALSSKRGR